MCWRERILTSRSSLVTYTAKEFVYVIILSLTASPRAAGFWHCGHQEGALLLPHTKPSSALKPWYKLRAENTSPANPWLGLCLLPTGASLELSDSRSTPSTPDPGGRVLLQQ